MKPLKGCLEDSRMESNCPHYDSPKSVMHTFSLTDANLFWNSLSWTPGHAALGLAKGHGLDADRLPSWWIAFVEAGILLGGWVDGFVPIALGLHFGKFELIVDNGSAGGDGEEASEGGEEDYCGLHDRGIGVVLLRRQFGDMFEMKRVREERGRTRDKEEEQQEKEAGRGFCRWVASIRFFLSSAHIRYGSCDCGQQVPWLHV